MIKALASAAAAACLLGSVASTNTIVDPRPGVDWPSFRGHRAAGIAEGFRTPETWDVATGKGVQWKTPVEGLGHSSPVVWGDRIYLTTAVSGKADAGLKPGLYGNIDSVADDTPHTWKLIALDKKSGKTLYNRTILTGVPAVKRHLKSTHANATLATDGSLIIAMLGSEGLYAFDMNGKQLWKQDFGVLDAGYFMAPAYQWEFSSSPVLHEGVVIVLADVQKGSFVAAHDAKTGKQLWRTSRADVPTFGSPTIHQAGGRTMVIVNGWRHTGAYDFKTGEEIWKLNGGGDIPTPTPITGHGFIYITNAHGKSSPVYAIKETAKGDISLQGDALTNDGVAWTAQQSGSYMSTPLLYGDLLYVTRWQGILLAFDAKTGERVYQQRLGEGGAFTASTVAGDGKLYFANEDGDVFVVKAGRTFEQIAKNSVGEMVFATPAISEGVIYFRTNRSVIALRR
jgi:outer membrane protein assembly factor BamB